MQHFTLIVLLAATALFFSACSNVRPLALTSSTANATYAGKLQIDDEAAADYVSLRLKPDGSLERINEAGNTAATGNWKERNKTFTATYASKKAA